MQCPTHKKVLTKIKAHEEGKLCNICAKYQPAIECVQCKFQLCSICRICPAKHGLLKIVELAKACPSYYGNAYKCDSCSKSKAVDDEGIWHCTQCKFDLCPDCAQ